MVAANAEVVILASAEVWVDVLHARGVEELINGGSVQFEFFCVMKERDVGCGIAGGGGLGDVCGLRVGNRRLFVGTWCAAGVVAPQAQIFGDVGNAVALAAQGCGDCLG